ncbi:MAG TPA: endonuclease/exonuclease/phosphatase family protein [Candidatus Nanoarchaeia archaeon]|nr:endonuclease/exonuclease/phosphatase family protein [Candidatus Nanoarchaeia archaeon]
MNLKIVEYNLLDGMHDWEEKPRLVEKRLKLVREVVHALNPDILVLIEACDVAANDHGIKVDYKKEFKLPYHYHFPAVSGKKHGNSILSRWPIISSENYSVYQRKFGRVQMKVNEKMITIDLVHPHPSLSEIERVQFFKGVLRDMKKPYLLVGDFNAWSLEDTKGRDINKVIATFKELPHYGKEDLEVIKAQVADRATCQSVEFVKGKDLIDTYRVIHKKGFGYTVPTDSFSTNKDAAGRLDFIFSSKDFKVLDSGIVKNKLTEESSDHYPIYAVLDI